MIGQKTDVRPVHHVRYLLYLVSDDFCPVNLAYYPVISHEIDVCPVHHDVYQLYLMSGDFYPVNFAHYPVIGQGADVRWTKIEVLHPELGSKDLASCPVIRIP